MKKSINCIIGVMTVLFFMLLPDSTVFASDAEYITISVDATDENGNLLYALDTDDPSAFTSNNEFSVPEGTAHTIYVKDAAGNISSQEFIPPESNSYISDDPDNRVVNIDVTLDDMPDYSDYEYEGDVFVEPAESGQGTVYDKVTTDASDVDAERLFYTVTTDEGEVFYLVIDQGQSTNNVYLLDQVNLSDLKALAVNDSSNTETDNSVSLLSALSDSDENSNNEDNQPVGSNADQSSGKSRKNSMTSNIIILFVIVVIGGGFYYYKNVYKSKKDEQMDLIDAPDKDDFVAEDDEEDDEADFGLDEDYQEQIMARLMDEENAESTDEENPAAAEEIQSRNFDTENSEEVQEKNTIDDYATSHKNVEAVSEEDDDFDDELDSPDDEEEE